MKKIMLAYSGGLDTSCALTWLKQTYKSEVVAYCADVGQDDNFGAVQAKALQSGAEGFVLDNLKSSFVKNYVYAALKANARYEGNYLLATALARPCIAAGLVESAIKLGCDAIAHGATGKGNDQVRFELAAKSLAPHLQIMAPWRTWPFHGRQDLFDYAEAHGIPLPVSKEKPYSIDANLMHTSYEGGILEDPWLEPPADMFKTTVDPALAPEQPAYVSIGFACGEPVTLNGQKLGPVDMLIQCNQIAGAHGVGRVDLVENRYIGIKSRGVYESPGATLLWMAHQAVESLTLDKEMAHLKEELALKFSSLVYNGYWFSPEMKVVQSATNATQAFVTGEAKVKLFKGSAYIVGRRAPASLYDACQSSFEGMQNFSAADSQGFININGLRLTNWSNVHERIETSVFAAAE